MANDLFKKIQGISLCSVSLAFFVDEDSRLSALPVFYLSAGSAMDEFCVHQNGQPLDFDTRVFGCVL